MRLAGGTWWQRFCAAAKKSQPRCWSWAHTAWSEWCSGENRKPASVCQGDEFGSDCSAALPRPSPVVRPVTVSSVHTELAGHGDEQHFFTVVHPKSTLPNQAPFYPSRNLRKSPTACLSLSLHELLSLSSPFTSHTHSARWIFTRASQRPYSSWDVDLPYFFLHPCSVGGQVPLYKMLERACLQWKKAKQQQTSCPLPFHNHPDEEQTRSSSVSKQRGHPLTSQ